MALSNDLISQFVKVTTNDNKKQIETTVYGTVKISDGKTYVQIDGSTMDTPISTTTDAKDGDRVMVMIKDHSAVITGNITAPSATKDSVDQVNKDLGDAISRFDIVMADKVNTEQLNAVKADIDDLTAKDLEVREKLTAAEADIDKLEVDNVKINETLTAHSGKFDDVDATFVNVSGQLTAANAKIETLEATDAEFRTLEADYGKFKQLTTDNLYAEDGTFKGLTTEDLYAEDGTIKYANIDFSNITKAAMEYFYASSGLIDNIAIGDGTIAGTLIGVTIKGDLIEAGTLVADKLVVKDSESGLYYKLNFESGTFSEGEVVPTDSLHGSVITTNSITATKINVDDLVAFDATIAGFSITRDSETGLGSIYSDVKDSDGNTTRGIYMDTEGQFNFGDADNFVRYHKTMDEDGNEVYRLEIAADSVLFGGGSKKSMADLEALAEHVKLGTYTDLITGETEPSIELAEGDTDFKQVITNTKAVFMDGNTKKTQVDKDGINTDKLSVNKEFRQGDWIWKQRSNGNLGLMWKEVAN